MVSPLGLGVSRNKTHGSTAHHHRKYFANHPSPRVSLLSSKSTLLRRCSLASPRLCFNYPPTMSGKKAAENALSFVGKVTLDQVKKANKGKGEIWVAALKTASEETKRRVGVPSYSLDFFFPPLQI